MGIAGIRTPRAGAGAGAGALAVAMAAVTALISVPGCSPGAGETASSPDGSASPGPPPLDLDGRPVEVLRAGRDRLTVLFFVRTDCPTSNRYAPEIRRIFETYASRGVAFWLVYTDPDEDPDTIRRHREAYRLPLPVVRDLAHAFVRRTGATITPTAVVFRSGGDAAYRGRIDDRYADFGRARPAAGTHDLTDALDALLAGRDPAVRITRAVGCPIPSGVRRP